jgi:hypothetical protein
MLAANNTKMLHLARTLTYQSSEAMYADEKAYMAFIGEEIDTNAKFGVQMLMQRMQQGYTPKVVVETAAGTGATSRDLHKLVPDVQAHCVEWSERMCTVGRKLNPHLNFIQGDMCDWEQADASVDLAYNSASSLAFLNIRKLHQHIKQMARVMTDGASYYCEVGYYGSVQAPYLNQSYIDKGNSTKGQPVKNFNCTTAYYPKTDFHNICYSSWSVGNGGQAQLVETFGHELRSYRFSEMEYLAELEGLQARLWYYTYDEKLKLYKFEEITEQFFVQDTNDYAFVVEFYKGDAPRMDATTDEQFLEISKTLKGLKK